MRGSYEGTLILEEQGENKRGEKKKKEKRKTGSHPPNNKNGLHNLRKSYIFSWYIFSSLTTLLLLSIMISFTSCTLCCVSFLSFLQASAAT